VQKSELVEPAYYQSRRGGSDERCSPWHRIKNSIDKKFFVQFLQI